MLFLTWPKHVTELTYSRTFIIWKSYTLSFYACRSSDPWSPVTPAISILDAVLDCSPHLFFFFLIECSFFFKTATKVKLLERNNRMTDCLFQIIGSTVQQAVGYDKNIPPRVPNFSNSLDRDNQLTGIRGYSKNQDYFPYFSQLKKKKKLNTSKERKLALVLKGHGGFVSHQTR